MDFISQEEFNKLSNAEKRVVIAKDVIYRVESKRLGPAKASLFNDHLVEASFEPNPYLDLQDLLNRENNGCAGCAKGALVCSWIGNFNHYKYDDIHRMSSDLRTAASYPVELKEIFGRKMLDLMEINFEGRTYPWTDESVKDSNINAEYNFNLLGIMENIVENNGEFIP